jgi:hypothetical protein
MAGAGGQPARLRRVEVLEVGSRQDLRMLIRQKERNGFVRLAIST